jgi:hypothetical protein
MNSELWWSNGRRFLLLVLVQGLLLQQLPTLTHEYVQIFIYPIIIMLLPLGLAIPALVVSGFFIGLSVDLFYGSMGVHAAASTLSAYVRPFIIAAYEPRSGFGKSAIPNVNISWFMRYAALFFGVHLLFYFMVEAFTLIYIGRIAAQTIIAWALSLLGVFMYMLIFNPEK